MSRGPIHAAKPGLTGDHRTDGLHCRCDPWHLVDINEPGRAVIVHRPMPNRSERTEPVECETSIQGRPKTSSRPSPDRARVFLHTQNHS